MIKAVADTNVYISGLFWPGLNRMVLNLARHDVIGLTCSPRILQEFSRTLKGKKFRLSEEQAELLVRDLMGFTLPGAGAPVSVPHLRDPKDQFLCDLAFGSQADYLLTGDEDLLVLKTIKKTRVHSARGFLQAEFPELLEAYEQGEQGFHESEPS